MKAAKVQEIEGGIHWYVKSNDLKKVVRSLAVVITVIKKWICYRASAVQVSGGCPVEVIKEHLDLAENLLISQAQSTMRKEIIDSLLPEVLKVKGVVREEHEIILVGGRERNQFQVGYDCPGVPALPYGHPLSKLYFFVLSWCRSLANI